MRRTLLFSPLLAILVAGCSVPVLIPVSGPNPDVAHRVRNDSLGANQRAVEGYYTPSGSFVPLDGYVVATGDSFRFFNPGQSARGLEKEKPGFDQTIPRDSVAAVRSRATHVVYSIAIAMGLVVMAAGVFALSLDDQMT